MFETVPDRGNQSQGSQGLPVPGIQAEQETGFRRRAGVQMAIVALPVFRRSMAAIAGHFTLVAGMGRPGGQLGLLPQFRVAIRAGRPVFHVLLGQIGAAVAVHIGFLVAIHAQHPLLIVHIRLTAILSCIFGIDPAAMAEGAGFPLIFLDEFMPLDQAETDAADRRRLDVATTAGGMATPAGLLKNLFIKLLQFRW